MAGLHWWWHTRSHAAEATAGYWNCAGCDGYAPLVAACARHGLALTLTCVEMCDAQHPPAALCGPEGLLRQVDFGMLAGDLWCFEGLSLTTLAMAGWEVIWPPALGCSDIAEETCTNPALRSAHGLCFLRLGEGCWQRRSGWYWAAEFDANHTPNANSNILVTKEFNCNSGAGAGGGGGGGAGRGERVALLLAQRR